MNSILTYGTCREGTLDCPNNLLTQNKTKDNQYVVYGRRTTSNCSQTVRKLFDACNLILRVRILSKEIVN